MPLCKTLKVVLRATPDPEKLLDGITSNTLDAPRNAFVDRFGRFVAAFDQIKVDKDVLIVVDERLVARLFSHVAPYLKLAPTRLVPERLHVYFNLDSSRTPASDEYAIPQKAGQLLLSPHDLDCDVDDEAFTLFRLKNGIPQQPDDFDREMVLNVGDEYVSFTKGCFLGQEVLSRVKNLGKAPYKLIVKYEDECTNEEKQKMTSKAVDNEGRVVGFLFVRS